MCRFQDHVVAAAAGELANPALLARTLSVGPEGGANTPAMAESTISSTPFGSKRNDRPITVRVPLKIRTRIVRVRRAPERSMKHARTGARRLAPAPYKPTAIPARPTDQVASVTV